MPASPETVPVVLIVEDEALIRWAAVAAFQKEQWVVVEAHCAEAAIRALETYPAVHLLFTDIDLKSSETGWDVAEACRTRHENAAVIYTSGVAREHSRRLDGSLFFEKPYDSDAVVDASRAMLMQKKA